LVGEQMEMLNAGAESPFFVVLLDLVQVMDVLNSGR
jgi:hypothetical protein